MLKKILYGLLILVVLLIATGGFLYWRFTQNNKPPISEADRARLTVMPLPAKAELKEDSLLLQALSVHYAVFTDERVTRSVQRMADFLQLSVSASPDASVANLIIDFHHETAAVQDAVEDEGYRLEIGEGKIKITSENAYGALRGIETLKQLAIEVPRGKKFIQGVIQDSPRYPWRGIMIDVSRHWIPKEVILRNLEAMAALKMNVLHWHLSDYQGFRVESKVFPKLHEKGSEGNYYTQDEIREVVVFARDRGIRIVPEFDMPGHATSWFAGYPELAVTRKEYKPDSVFGVLTPVMDPTREETYEFLDKFIAEMSPLFPDTFFHIGGDEVAPAEWNNSQPIQEFMRSHDMKDHHELQQYFNERVHEILRKNDKAMIGWDEILNPHLNRNAIVQAWRSPKKLWQAAQQGSQTILSAGYYLDHKLPAEKHYSVDPEILPGAVTITPDSLNWKEYKLSLKVSETVMEMQLVLYGQPEELRGLFVLMEDATAFEKASLENETLTFTFNSDYGEIDVEAILVSDSITGTMSLGFLSFPLSGVKVGGNDMAGTKAPEFEQMKPLTDVDKKQILGGEAAMWTEFVSAENIESRIWPRSAAIAEKLWSPAVLTKNVPDMYRRLSIADDYLDRLGLLHHKNQDAIIRGWGVDPSDQTIRNFIEAIEEIKYYDRMTQFMTNTTETPLNQVVDAALPESFRARAFNAAVKEFLADSTHHKNRDFIIKELGTWINNHQNYKELAANNSTLSKTLKISENLAMIAEIGQKSAKQHVVGGAFGAQEKMDLIKELDELSWTEQGVMIAIVPGVRELLTATRQ